MSYQSEAEKSIKILKILFKYNSTIQWLKMTIIIMVFFPMFFLWYFFAWVFGNLCFSYVFPMFFLCFTDPHPSLLSIRIQKPLILTRAGTWWRFGIGVWRTTELGCRTTNADAGVVIGMLKGDSRIWLKTALISRNQLISINFG